MELTLGELQINNHALDRIHALRTLTRLLLREIESLAEISPSPRDSAGGNTINLLDSVQRYEAALICNALIECQGNQRRAAIRLGMKNSTLHAKIRRYEIESVLLFGQSAEEGEGTELPEPGNLAKN